MNNNNDSSNVDIEKGDCGEQQHQYQQNTTLSSNGTTNDLKRDRSVVWWTVSLIVVCGISLVLASLFWYYMGWLFGIQALCVAGIAILLASGGWKWLYIAVVTAPRDVKGLVRYVRLLQLVKKYQKKNVTIGEIFSSNVAKHPDKTCFIFEDRHWTFKEVNDYANKIGNLFQSHGYKYGDKIALFMENRPEFVATWIGLSKLGIVVPLINTNLRLKSLVHSITVAKCNALIFSESLASATKEVIDELPATLSYYQMNDSENANLISPITKDLKQLLAPMSKDRASSVPEQKYNDNLLYIYTSGTTGLPKAAVISHSRYVFMAGGIHFIAPFKNDDIFYVSLPLYHTAGGVMSIGQALLFGNTVVIRKKFSASNFFTDCQKYKCTIAHYIGEMCRYILATPKSDADRNHNVRLVFGNGLRPQIWPQFVERFGIKQVLEFYGATEGNANIVNIDNTVGAIGFVSRIIPSVYPISIIKADPNTGEPIRGPDGLCQVCQPNEPGVFIGKILPNNPSRAFLGYVDKSASEKKIVTDVFKKGDSAFISGDILLADERGYLYFKDRTGDTFRWKGENVSTSEVEAQVSNEAGYRDAVVFGVEVPHSEGRAGMAAILDPEHKVDFTALSDGLKRHLPPYARPQFIRLLSKVDMTGTFKLKKLDLQKEGYNPNTVPDEIYYLTNKGQYARLTPTIYEQILSGEIRL